MTDLQTAIERLVERHGGLRAAARAMRLKPQYLSHLRTGRRKNPSLLILRKLGIEREVVFRSKIQALAEKRA